MNKLILNKKIIPLALLLCITNLIGSYSFSQTSCLVNGVNITVTGTSSTFGYSTPTSTVMCLPTGAFTGSGAWTGVTSTGVVVYSFDQPLTTATVAYSAVNHTGLDVGEVTVDGGGVLSLTSPCGVSVLGNVLTCNLTGTAPNVYGDVSITVESTLPFTAITLTNIGANSGWVQAYPCDFKCCIATATLTSPAADVSTTSTAITMQVERADWIKATNIIDIGNSLYNGVVYHAGNFIELNPGFETLYAAKFAAYPQGCTDPQSFIYRKRPSNFEVTGSDYESVLTRLKEIQLSPNPSSKFMTISYDSNLKNIRITAMDGKLMLDQTAQEAKQEIDVSTFAKGIYLVSVETEDGKILKSKFIKN